MTASITIITCPVKDPDQFEAMELAERRRTSGGWDKFPLRAGRYVDTFVMKATESDFGVFGSSDELVDEDGVTVESAMIDGETILRVIPDLEALVEMDPEATARALVAHGGNTANVERVTAILRSGHWPESGDAAEEAAAFAHQLLRFARSAKGDELGVCWEYRGKVRI